MHFTKAAVLTTLASLVGAHYTGKPTREDDQLHGKNYHLVIKEGKYGNKHYVTASRAEDGKSYYLKIGGKVATSEAALFTFDRKTQDRRAGRNRLINGKGHIYLVTPGRRVAASERYLFPFIDGGDDPETKRMQFTSATLAAQREDVENELTSSRTWDDDYGVEWEFFKGSWVPEFYTASLENNAHEFWVCDSPALDGTKNIYAFNNQDVMPDQRTTKRKCREAELRFEDTNWPESM